MLFEMSKYYTVTALFASLLASIATMHKFIYFMTLNVWGGIRGDPFLYSPTILLFIFYF